ncbi:glutamyl-tRNA reductase [Desulfitispora alkaliphila]|uniref:glutamyl-tRNA reductase n=1 Tax=Desulfitispora alkaliphila TaxID=622674 RepID=UPI003D1A518C
MFIVVVGLNHKTAPVEIREGLAFSSRTIETALGDLHSSQDIYGCAILSTCNRTEFYAAVTDVDAGLKAVYNFIDNYLEEDIADIKHYLYTPTCENAIRHLFRVAAGLDSMVLGETQILGQVKEAYQLACEHKVSNNVLNTLFQNAITVGKRVRTETAIDKTPVSISYTAVELAKQLFGDLTGFSTLIIGAGEMSELTAKHLVANGVSSVLVSNRSYDRAVELAHEFGGNAVRFDELFEHMKNADIIISCTASPKYIIDKEKVEEVMLGERKGKKLFMIDIAVPRDIHPDVGKIDGVSLYDIDSLQNVVDNNLAERKEAAKNAEIIIEDELSQFLKWVNSLFVVPTIVALKEKGEQIKKTEMQKAFNKFGTLTEREKNIIGALSNSIVNQLLHDPIVNLKEYADTSQGHLYTEIMQNLHGLDVKGQKNKN